MNAITTGRPTGRPSLFSEELADLICDMIVEGYSLVQICKVSGMPSRGTVIRWMKENETFCNKVRVARAEQADLMDDLIMEEARNANADNFQAAKVRISAYQWRASKLAPKVYGDRTDLNITGTLQTLPQEALDARITELLRKAGAGTLALGEPETDREE